MGLTKNIKKLVAYGIGARLIQPEDEIFMINQYLDLFGLDEYDDPNIDDEKIVLVDILNALTDEAFEKGIIQSDDIVTRDLFDTKLMGIMTPRPSAVQKTFNTYYEKGPKYATDYFYELSENSNYIRKDRIQKDKKWTVHMVLLILRLIFQNQKKILRRLQQQRTQNRVRIQSASFA